ncbi:Fatty-acid amide hydrolase 2 [Paramuricea clavata]|uniref:Fatty-acid amide hydrolase 2 n=1 Tax=Paramuricea clavata TaxID=317549 RepID=A0A6S7GSD1_PARCT|nr:Fatty-acid amide hydrolase 2 [Paramuricea clavata]
MAVHFTFILVLFLVLIFALRYIYNVLTKPGLKVSTILNKDKPILTLSASILVEKLQNGELRSEQIVQTYIARIKAVNGFINVVVQQRFEAALDEAREVDKRLENLSESERKAVFNAKVLYGAPFTCKEAFGFKGFAQTGGLVRRRNTIASKNAVVVQKILDAGAILLAATNVSELCMWWESTNCVYGRSLNPYNTEHIVGGSSGGEAAIIAAAGSVIGIGSDIGGSIRMPAFFNGVFGHKPSPRMVSNLGQFPVNCTEAAELMLSTGPICRYAVDLTLMLKVMSSDADFKKRLESNVDIDKLKFYSIDNCGLLASKVSPELLKAQEKVCQFFGKKIGASVTKLELPLIKHAIFIWLTKMSVMGGPSFGEMLFGVSNRATGLLSCWEVLKWCVGQSDYTFPAIRLAAFESLKNVLPKSLEQNSLRNGENLRVEIEEILGEDGVLLFPSHPSTALRHNVPIFKPNNFIYTGIFNALHLPVTQVPLGLDSNGLPLGIQVVAARNNDHLTLAVAEALEREFGGWVPPSLDAIT